MTSYCRHRDLFFLGAIIKEDPVSRRCVLLGIRVKHFLATGPVDPKVFVSLETRMSWILRKKAKRFGNGFVPLK